MSTVTEIQAGAFKGTGITDVLIPSSVTSIGTEAFANCTSLTNVVLERYGVLGYTTLGTDCFSGTSAINSTNFACLHDIYINNKIYLNFLRNEM